MSLKPGILCTFLRRALLGACALPLLALAQEPPPDPVPQAQSAPDPAPPADAKTLDRIIVTAQSREQELQDVPIALQVIDAQVIEDVAAEDLGDLDSFVRSEAHTSELQSLMRISYAVFCLKKKTKLFNAYYT